MHVRVLPSGEKCIAQSREFTLVKIHQSALHAADLLHRKKSLLILLFIILFFGPLTNTALTHVL